MERSEAEAIVRRDLATCLDDLFGPGRGEGTEELKPSRGTWPGRMVWWPNARAYEQPEGHPKVGAVMVTR
jgi:hypothetical protein